MQHIQVKQIHKTHFCPYFRYEVYITVSLIAKKFHSLITCPLKILPEGERGLAADELLVN